MTEMQGCCLEQSPPEALFQAFLLIATNGSLVPGFGMPTSILNYLKEELIQPQHRLLVHGQQHTLLILIINVRNSAPNEQSRTSQKSLMLSAAELWGPPSDMAQAQSRIFGIWKPHPAVPMMKERSLPPTPET